MSYDLYFYKGIESPLTEKDIFDYLNKYLPHNKSDIPNQWYYNNEETGVYFLIHQDNNSNLSSEDNCDIYPGFKYLNLYCNINFLRPRYFGLEIFHLIDNLSKDLDLFILNPQDNINNEIPFKYEKDYLRDQWIIQNDQNSIRSFYELDLKYYPEDKSNYFWWFLSERKNIQNSLKEDVFVAGILFLEGYEDKKIYTATTWTEHIPVILPPVDFVIVNKKYKKFFETIEETGLIPYKEIMEKFGSFFKEFKHEFPGLKIIHQHESECIKPKFNRLKIWKTTKDFGKLIEKDGFVNVRPEEVQPKKVIRLLDNKEKIYPWIKVVFDTNEIDTGKEILLSGEDAPIRKKWLGDLEIFYVIDQGNNFRIIQNRDIDSEITIEQLHELAVENLERDVEFRFVETSFGGHGLIAGGDHEAGSICLPHIWKWCSDQVNDDLIVGIPAKDMITMVPASNPEKIHKLKDFIRELFKDGERLLTKQLFIFHKEENKWDLYQSAI
jgi:uncharacterized protein YtpQ (UPF0354 family)